MRCLALDVGEERIGVAISDELGLLARPLEIIARKAGPSSFQRIAALVVQYGVQLVVVGLPLLPDGAEGQQARSTRAYIQGLGRHVEVPMALWDERLSTQQARAIIDQVAGAADWDQGRRRRGPRKARRRPDDAVAAAVILQEYLNAQSEATDKAETGRSEPLRAVRIFLRLITLVLSLSLVIFVLAAGFWYVWQDARGRAPEVGYAITATKAGRAAVGLYLRYRSSDVNTPADPDNNQERVFIVESGDSVYKVAQNLENIGLIRDASLFRRIVQYLGADADIEAGVYALRASLTMEQIARELQHGRMASTTVTIPEGWRAEEIAQLLEETGIVSAQEFMQAVTQQRAEPAFLADRPAGSPASLEGFLFPDTYQFPKRTSAAIVVEMMLENWDRRVTPETRQMAQDSGRSLYEVVTLASIVEREAVLPEERALIAGVYTNRLEMGMMLQADPTVQYALGYNPEKKLWWNQLMQRVLETTVSPYNTYLNAGLDAGPHL